MITFRGENFTREDVHRAMERFDKEFRVGCFASTTGWWCSPLNSTVRHFRVCEV